jgi:E-phenylitaconyl-CoA hydratase
MAIDYEIRDNGVAIVTMNRPEKLNALNKDDLHRIADVFTDLRHNPKVQVAIITGAGNRAFTSGMDLSMPRDSEKGPPRDYQEVPDGLMLKMLPYMKGIDIWKPIIAAINGHAIALGACMILGTDIRIAAPNATFALNEVLFGGLADGGAFARLPRQIPYAHAMKLLLTGERIDAQEMLRIGLINEIVPPDKLMPRALEIAEYLVTKCNKHSLQITKQAVVRGLDMGQSQALIEEALYAEMLENRGEGVGLKEYAKQLGMIR